MTWAEIRSLTIHQLVHELGGAREVVNEQDSRREGAARVLSQIRDKHGLSLDELRATDIDTVRGWAIELTGKPVDPNMFRDLFLQYVNA